MKYDYFQDEKLKYEEIEVPDELLLMVRQTVAADRRKKAIRQRNRIIRMAGSIAAVLFLCLTIGVNSSYAFAETAVKIPVVKSVAKAVIVRSYKADIIALDEQKNKEPENTPDTEHLSEKTAPAVSDNDVVLEEETPEQPTEQELEKEPEGLDAWKTEMTLEKLKEVKELYTPDMEEQYAETPEKLRTILIAELPEKDISLYGYHEDGKITGTALRIKDTYQYFDWNYMNDSKKLPDISCTDIDGDGEGEIVVLLYNRTPQKKEMKEISKADIEAPGEKQEESQKMENTEGQKTEKSTNPSDTAKTTDETINKSKADEQEGTSVNNTQETISEDDTKETAESEKPSISGNDIKNPVETEERPKPQAGEIWVVSIKEENWSASLLSTDDYESQILHQLKAEYNEEETSIQLYLTEAPFGVPLKLPPEETEKLTYETINLAPEREFLLENGLTLQFNLDATFLDENEEKIFFPLNRKLEAEIHLEGGSLIIEGIKEQ